ncbi:hypothetical protein SAY87_003996 [Trapa incisa]|uniref:Uncharacterized protein n=1 Tax=Trapa incisa TaxID=236973 RepID=A0AAN7PL86_9MYRT|nr:hypothetical protein SAY87_003996 [Trapa incisa]
MSSAAASQCSSGVESGWTHYLDDDGGENGYSFASEQCPRRVSGRYSYRRSWKEEDDDGNNNDNDSEENLSMVSDASSGPPYNFEVLDWRCHLDGGGSLAGLHGSSNMKDNRQQKNSGRRSSSNYEDTACSQQKSCKVPGYGRSDDFSQGHSGNANLKASHDFTMPVIHVFGLWITFFYMSSQYYLFHPVITKLMSFGQEESGYRHYLQPPAAADRRAVSKKAGRHSRKLV